MEGGKCINQNVCGCEIDYIINDSKSKCLPIAKKESDNCEENKQCENLNATCSNGSCLCQLNHHFSSTESKCISNKSNN